MRRGDALKGRTKLTGRDYQRKHKYGLSREAIAQMLLRQEYRCAILGEPITAETCKVDHDHGCCPGKKTCGRCVRGLLCAGCNIKLGALESAEFMYRSAIYRVKYVDASAGRNPALDTARNV